MNREYYYLIASLPHLIPDEDPPITPEEFLEKCRSSMSEEAFELVKSTELNSPELHKESDLLKSWWKWEISIRNSLVRLRAEKLGWDPQKYLKGNITGTGLVSLSNKMFDGSSPSEAEQILNDARWNKLEDLALGNYFNLEKVVIYYLKLQLMERTALRKKEEEGMDRLKEIMARSNEMKDRLIENRLHGMVL